MQALQNKSWFPYAILFPLVVLLIYVAVFGVDIPFYDPWTTMPVFVSKFYSGTLTLSDLFSQNNEHRTVIPWLIQVPLALLTGWNTKIEMGVQMTFAVATFFLIRQQLYLSWKQLDIKPSNGLLLMISVLVFSLSQWENWLNGEQLIITLFSLLSVCSLFLLANPDLTGQRLILAMLCVSAAQFTMAAGVILWGTGLILLWMTAEGVTRKILFAVLWLVAAGASTLLYFWDFRPEASPFGLDSFLSQPLAYLLYVFTFLGAPMMTFYTAAIAAVIGCVLLGLILFDILRKRLSKELTTFLPYIALCVYALLLAFAIGVGRLGDKWWLALSPRYIGFSVWFWVGLIALLSFKAALANQNNHSDQLDQLNIFWRRFASKCLGLIFVLSLGCSILGAGLGIYLRYMPLSAARNALIAGKETDETLVQIYPNAAFLRRQLEVAKQYRLTIYR